MNASGGDGAKGAERQARLPESMYSPHGCVVELFGLSNSDLAAELEFRTGQIVGRIQSVDDDKRPFDLPDWLTAPAREAARRLREGGQP